MQLVFDLLHNRALAAAPQSESQVVANAEVGIERIALKDHGHIALGRTQPTDGLLADEDFSCTRNFQARHQTQKGAFPAA